MQIARVVGTVVATAEEQEARGSEAAARAAVDARRRSRRERALLAIDSVGAGVGEKVLVVIEGKAAGDALGKKAAAVDAAIIGIVDAVEITA